MLTYINPKTRFTRNPLFWDSTEQKKNIRCYTATPQKYSLRKFQPCLGQINREHVPSVLHCINFLSSVIAQNTNVHTHNVMQRMGVFSCNFFQRNKKKSLTTYSTQIIRSQTFLFVLLLVF